MKMFWKLLWIAFLFVASLAFIIAGMAVFLVIGLVLLALCRRAERGLTPAKAPDERMPMAPLLPDLPRQQMLDDN